MAEDELRPTRTAYAPSEPKPSRTASVLEPDLYIDPVVQPPTPAPTSTRRVPKASEPAKVVVIEPYRPRVISSADVASVNSLVKVYRGSSEPVEALRGVDLCIADQQMTVIMGRSGSGKTTLLNCLSALDTPSAGTIMVGREEVSALKQRGRTKFRRDCAGFIFQDFSLIPSLSVAENIAMPLYIRRQSADQGWYDQIVVALQISSILTKKPGELSAGQQQRVACARALIKRPAIIFADEPTGNLDTTSATETMSILKTCVDQLLVTIMVATHDPAVACFGDHVFFLEDGAIVTELAKPTIDQVIQVMRALAQSESDS